MVKGNAKEATKIFTDAFGKERAQQIINFINQAKSAFDSFKQWLLSFRPTVENVFSIFKNLSPIIGAIGIAFAGLMSILPPILNVFTSIVQKITAWEGFIPVVAGLTAGFVAFKTALMLQTLWMNKARIATKLMTVAQRVLNTVMRLNPIGLIVTALIALGVGLVTAYKHSETFRNAVNALWQGIKSGFQIIWNFLVQFFTVMIPQWFNSAKQWFSDLWTSLQTQVSVFVTAFMIIWNRWKTRVVNIVTMFVTMVKTKFNQFVAGVKAIIQPFVDFFINTWKNLKLMVLGIIGAFFSLITGDFEGLKLAIQAILTAIKRQAINIWNLIKTTVTAVVRTFWNNLKSLFNAGKSFIQSVLSGAKNLAISIFNRLKTGAINAVTSLWSLVKSLFSAGKSFVTDTASNIKSFVVDGFNSMKRGARDAVMNMFNAVREWFGKIIGNARETAENLIEKFTSIDLFEVGKDIINGLWRGIVNAKDAVLDKAKEIADGIKSKITGALSIASPSKWAISQMGWLGRGLSDGMDKSKDMVEKASGKLAEAVKRPMSDVGMTADQNAKVEQTGTLKHEFDLRNVPEHINESELVRMMKRALDDKGVQDKVDRVNYINRKRTNKPQGRFA